MGEPALSLEPYWAAVKLPGKRANTRAVKCQLIHVCEYRLHLTSSLAAKLGLAAHGPLADCLFARLPARLPVSAHAQVTSLSFPLSLSQAYAHVLLLVLFLSPFERWAFAGFGFVVRSFGLSGAASDSRHTQAGRQPGSQATIRITASQKYCGSFGWLTTLYPIERFMAGKVGFLLLCRCSWYCWYFKLKFLYCINNGECFRSIYSLRSSIGEKTRTHLITEKSCVRIIKVKKSKYFLCSIS